MQKKQQIYTAKIIAEWFLSKIDYDAGDTISPLKLQKLLYYAQAWSLAIFDRVLFEEDFEAWTHGPAIPSIYREYKQFAYDNIPHSNSKIKLDKEVEGLLDDIWAVYGERSAKYLENMTHSEKPWIETRGRLSLEAKCERIISKNLMKNFYKKQFEELKKKTKKTPA